MQRKNLGVLADGNREEDPVPLASPLREAEKAASLEIPGWDLLRAGLDQVHKLLLVLVACIRYGSC